MAKNWQTASLIARGDFGWLGHHDMRLIGRTGAALNEGDRALGGGRTGCRLGIAVPIAGQRVVETDGNR